MIHKQQMFIEENQIGTSAAAQAGNIEIFLGEDNPGEDEVDDEEEDDNNDEDDNYRAPS